MDPSDPGEGPSRPRRPPARWSIRERLSMVDDMENVDENSYQPHSRTFSVSTDSNDGGEEIEIGLEDDRDCATSGKYTPPDSPGSGSTFGSSLGRSFRSRPRSLNSLTSPWRTQAFERYQERESEGGWDAEGSTSGPSSRRVSAGPIGQVSIHRPPLQRSSSVGTASSYALYSPRTIMTDSSDVPSVPPIPTPYSLPPHAVPTLSLPPLPHLKIKRISDSSSREDWNDRSVLKQTPARSRPSSINTASSYALYTPRSASSSKQVRFSEVPSEEVPPIPPHALQAMADIEKLRSPLTSPRFFHGPPPLFNSDEIPPPYLGDMMNFWTNRKEKFKARFVGIKEKSDTESDYSEKSCYKKRSKLFWILVGLGIFLVIFGIVMGVVVGLIKQRGGKGGILGTDNDIISPKAEKHVPPPPLSILGLWTYPTNLTDVERNCSNSEPTTGTDVWTCYPYQTPPSTDPAIFNFIINTTDTGPNAATNWSALTIQTPNNPFSLEFDPIPLKLYRSIVDEYYTFTYNFSKITIVNVNNSAAQCTFPHSSFVGRLWFNLGYPGSGPINAVRKATDTRGEWNGRVEITEIKHGGGDEVVCQNRYTQVVDYVGKKSSGTCKCQYTNFLSYSGGERSQQSTEASVT